MPLWGMSLSLSSQLPCWMGCSTLAVLVLQQLLQPQQSILCWDKSPSPHFQGSIPVQAGAVWQNPWQRSLGRSVWDRDLPSSGWKHPCGAHGFSFGPAVPCQHSGLGFICSYELFSQHLQLWDCTIPQGAKQGKGCQRFSCIIQAVFAQENSAGSGTRLGQCRAGSGWHGSGVWPWWGAWCLSRLLCQTAPSSVSSLCSSGGELGVRRDEDTLLPMGPSCKTSWMPGSS